MLDGGRSTRTLSALGCLVAALVLAACGGGTGTGGGEADAGDELLDAGTDPVVADGGTDAGTPAGPDGGTGVPVTLKSLTPPRGPLGGGNIVVVTGRGFVEGFAETGGVAASTLTQVTFGGNAAVDVNVIDDDTLEVKAPAGARGAVDVVLTNPNGSVTCAGCFTYFEAVELSRVAPAQGTTLGGDAVTLQGKGFVPGVLVLFGAQPASEVQVAADGLSLTARTPPGAPGSVDVGVVGPNSSAFLRRVFVYSAPMAVRRVTPPSAPLAGGTPVTIEGSGFTADAVVRFGGEAATQVVVKDDATITARAPAMALPGAVDVTVTSRRGQASLARAFAYYDESRGVQLYTVSPRQGPTTGGTCAQGPGTCLELVGAGFTGDGLMVRVGAATATYKVVDDHLVQADLPPGAPGVVDVQVRTARGGARLAGAFAYVEPLEIASISPDAADASGTPAVQATLTGVGFSQGCKVFVGPAEAAVTSVGAGGTSLTVTVPPGPAGARDVRVTCGDAASADRREAVLAGGFTFSTPLSVLQVDPDAGAIAGNTQVTLYGGGFAQGLAVAFGRNPATQLQVKSPVMAVMRSPRGNVGLVDVTATQGAETATLKAAYGYFDPTNINGGGSGGPMRGTLNVTVLNSTPMMSGPVEGVTVTINDDQLKGVTDDRGQVTFSDPSLLKPVTITGSKDKFASTTIARIDARNVTLYMQMNDGGEPSDGEPPPAPEPATLNGRVCGFKAPLGRVLEDGQRYEARVYMTVPYVYAAPPFRNLATPLVVTGDCGTFTLKTRRFGPLALYAEYGVADNRVSPATFEPLLMGVKRGLEAAPGRVVNGADIVLDMHLDATIPVDILPAQAPPGRTVLNVVYSYLDLGGEGIVPLAQTQSAATSFLFRNHPRVSGEGLIFLNLAAMADLQTGDIAPPYSLYYRRQYGDPTAGVEIGPMLAFTQLTTPTNGGVFAGTLGWSFLPGQRADVTSVMVEEPAGFSMRPMWEVVLPATEQAVSLPRSVFARFGTGSVMYWTVITARSPRFDYDRFGYQQLGINAWTSFTQDSAVFTTP
jgi:hypothetical protein